MPEWREMTEQIDWREKQPSQVARVSEDLKCWGAWDTNRGHKAKDITPSIAWRREAWKEEALDDLPWKDERGSSSIWRTQEPFQRQCWGNVWEREWSTYGLFRAHRYHIEVNGTDLNSSTTTLKPLPTRCWRINMMCIFSEYVITKDAVLEL